MKEERCRDEERERGRGERGGRRKMEEEGR